jgi:hypothetical protein
LNAPGVSPTLRLLHALKPIREGSTIGPTPGSPADLEKQTFESADALDTAYSYGSIILESAADHLAAYDALVGMNAFSMAPLTCLRGLLEAAALASWQLDPAITAKERVARNFALRFCSLTVQRKVAEAQGDTAGVRKMSDRIMSLEQAARGLGYPSFRNSKGRPKTVGCNRPTITALLRSELNSDAIYGPLSALAHGDAIALFQVGFSSLGRVDGVSVGKKQVSTQLLLNFLATATLAYMQPAWHHIVLFGRDQKQGRRVLDTAADELGLATSEDVRFWRDSGNS